MSENDWSKAPEGATHYDPADHSSSRWVKINESGRHYWAFGEKWRKPKYKSTIPANDKLIPRPTKTEWVDGLPPVGCECEFRYVSGQWGRAKVDYIGRQVIVFTDDNGAERTEYRHNSENFRPIQTPGQRMR